MLALVARGRANKAIAFELGVAEKTVKTHVGNILGKLGLSDRTQAALYAVREGLGLTAEACGTPRAVLGPIADGALGGAGRSVAGMHTPTLTEAVRRELLVRSEVTESTHRFGGIEFRLGRRELGHLHGEQHGRPAVPAPDPRRADRRRTRAPASRPARLGLGHALACADPRTSKRSSNCSGSATSAPSPPRSARTRVTLA